MKLRLLKSRPSLVLLLMIALLALLPLLAVLQYDLLGKVSSGEHERMKSNLKVSAAQFCQDFDREVKNIYLNFQTGNPPLGAPQEAMSDDEESDREFAARYHRWLDTASYPRLVSDIYQIENSGDEKYQLTRFNPATSRFEPCQWPEKLRNTREKLMEENAARKSAHLFLRMFNSRSEKETDKTVSGTFIHFSLGPIDEEIPGLIIPVMSLRSSPGLPGPQDLGNLSLLASREQRIVALDLDYIKLELFPSLAKKYFFHDGRSEYNIAVVSRSDPQKIIYRSDEGLSGNFIDTCDVSENLLKFQISEADRMFITKLPKLRNVAKNEKARESKGENKRFSLGILQRNIKVSDKRGGGGPDEMAKPILKLNNEGYWQVAVKHRSGSLEAAVAGARRRNLAISFGILVLLGVSVGLIVLSSRRAQRLASQQMEFVAGVSHEFRTPLAVICSAGENLADGVIDNGEQIKRYGGLIRDEGRRLTEMVEQVLEFAGTHSQRIAYELRPTDPNRVVEDALAASRMQLVESGFEIEKNLAAAMPQVNADAPALSRAIQNLLNNAMKYSGESRWLGLSVESVKTEKGEEVQIKVSDRGIGIPPSDLPRIFEPFYRGREIIAAQIHGNGLGLSLVNNIIEAHGGRMSVASKIRQGATFTLHLPAVIRERKR
jgi:signal transduction histidine kinase